MRVGRLTLSTVQRNRFLPFIGRRSVRNAEYTATFSNVARLLPGVAPASLAQRERIALYCLVYGLAPQYCLEAGTFNGGSAFIISGALDDIGLDGRLLCVEPLADGIYPEMVEATKHNTTIRQGYFPTDIPTEFDGQPTEKLFEFCFYDADHSYEGVRDHLTLLPRWMKLGAFVLCHDGYNAHQARGIREAVQHGGYIDCGMITRCANDIADPEQHYGGVRLLKIPGELPANS